MLVLTRKTDQQIMIGDDIKITLLRIRPNSVRVGIEAPRNIRILRGELEWGDPPSGGGQPQQDSESADKSARELESAQARTTAGPPRERSEDGSVSSMDHAITKVDKKLPNIVGRVIRAEDESTFLAGLCFPVILFRRGGD